MNKVLSFLKSLFKSSKGFTLIELLIVIAILGILATAVLSAINPVEQINRSRDTGTQSDAEQLLSAVQRFNASQGYFPWLTSAADVNGSGADHIGQPWAKVADGVAAPNGWTVDNAGTQPAANPAVAGNNVLDILGSTQVNATNELLTAYTTRVTGATYNTLYVYNHGTNGNSTYVCFKPQSQQFAKTAATRCAAKPADYPNEACLAPNGTGTANYICLP